MAVTDFLSLFRDGTMRVTSSDGVATGNGVSGNAKDNEDSQKFRYNRLSSDVEHDKPQPLHWKVFPGRPGPLHSTKVKEISNDSNLRQLLHDLKFEDMVEMASMFNFLDPTATKLLGNRRVIAQVDDSNWSTSFTLESAGVNQVLTVDHIDKGTLEVAFKVNTAQGRIANYTKIVRFSPRFIVVNKLNTPARIIQANGFLFEKVPIEVTPGYLKPFHLPAVFGERKVVIEVDGPWKRSVAFDLDQIGSNILKINRSFEQSNITHILSRGSPEYDVLLPPGEVGIWFETDWFSETIVVMRIKPDSFASLRTEVQIGDVLLSIDGESMSNKDFDDVMSIFKSKLQTTGCTMRLLTVEEKLRRIRTSAMMNQSTAERKDHSANSISNATPIEDFSEENSQKVIKVEMRAIDSSVFMFISELDKNARPEYRVVNRSASNIIHYRQKGINGGRWSSLLPGLSSPYIWDDTFKPHILLVRMGKNVLCPSLGVPNILDVENEKSFNFISVNTSENMFASIFFDDIGASYSIPVDRVNEKLTAQILSQGPTKQLKIFSPGVMNDLELNYSFMFITEQISILNSLKVKMGHIMSAPAESSSGNNNDPKVRQVTGSSIQQMIQLTLSDSLQECKRKQEKVLNSLKIPSEALEISGQPVESLLTSHVPFESLLGPVITKCNTLQVKVIEAKGLKPVQFGGTGESYCEVKLKCTGRSRKR